MNNETAIAIPVGPGREFATGLYIPWWQVSWTPKVRERGHDLRALEGVESSLIR